MDSDDFRLALVVIFVGAVVLGTIIGGCYIGLQRDRLYVEHGYTKTVMPGWSGTVWVAPDSAVVK